MIEIKSLEFKNGYAGDYVISPSYGQGPRKYFLGRGNKLLSWHDTFAEAELAAQNDHKICILSSVDFIKFKNELIEKCKRSNNVGECISEISKFFVSESLVL